MAKSSHTQEMLLQQKLSPRQILLTRLLQIPIDLLEQRIEQEMMENPALVFEGEDDDDGENLNENLEDNQDEDEIESLLSDEKIDDFSEEENERETVKDADAAYEDSDTEYEEVGAEKELNLDDYFNEDYENEDYHNASAGKDEEQVYSWEQQCSSDESFQESLFAQLGMFALSEKDRKTAVFLIGSLDENGYLNRSCEDMRDDLIFNENIDATPEHLEKIVANVVHKLEPAGVGARNLQECLLLQLKRHTNAKDKISALAYRIIDKYFEDFTKKHFTNIRKSLGCSIEQFNQAIAVLLRLNPKPSVNFATAEHPGHIIPDFIVLVNDKTQELELSAQSPDMPKLKIGKTFQRLYNDLKTKTSITAEDRKEALDFVKQKVTSAQWFIDALSQRDKTLYKTMYAIMDWQKEFFLSGEEIKLKPMVLKDIANQIELDISTVSRSVRLKHVLTPYGVYSLKFFFSESIMREDGTEVSSYEIKKIIVDIIAAEKKNSRLNDKALCDILNKKGYRIARRTVAKYREILGISVARLRKYEQFAK
ncbi:MAG: RNA polymerase factor sigma-54 [Lentimicrobiaceae bacterium]|nr:RNA polymerase factor sigma-54 [Lentimicrobiaceae bacterium]